MCERDGPLPFERVWSRLSAPPIRAMPIGARHSEADTAAAGTLSSAGRERLLIKASEVAGALFDLDGVITSTAHTHFAAWKATFDPLLAREGLPPFTAHDYRSHVDGRPREAGIVAFLSARGLAPDGAEVARLAADKNAAYLQALAREGVRVMPGARELLAAFRREGCGLALVTASRNAPAVLKAASLADAFDAGFDGTVAARHNLSGKPAPDVPAAALAALGIAPQQAVLFEDAAVGIRAGQAAAIERLVGVGGPENAHALRAAGASAVVASLEDVEVRP